MKAVLIKIHGKVQGVGFRNSLAKQAQGLEISGWCRNRNDGSVEAWAQGNALALSALIAWCHKGPPLAKVSTVETSEEKIEIYLSGFARRETC